MVEGKYSSRLLQQLSLLSSVSNLWVSLPIRYLMYVIYIKKLFNSSRMQSWAASLLTPFEPSLNPLPQSNRLQEISVCPVGNKLTKNEIGSNEATHVIFPWGIWQSSLDSWTSDRLGAYYGYRQRKPSEGRQLACYEITRNLSKSNERARQRNRYRKYEAR